MIKNKDFNNTQSFHANISKWKLTENFMKYKTLST